MSLTRRKLPYLKGNSIDYLGSEHFETLSTTNKLWFYKYNPITKDWVRYEDNTYGTYKISDKDLISLNLCRTELILEEITPQFITFKLFLLQYYNEVGLDLYTNICEFI